MYPKTTTTKMTSVLSHFVVEIARMSAEELAQARRWVLAAFDNRSMALAKSSNPLPQFKESLWQKRIDTDGIIRPHGSTDFFWPATRARNMVKMLDNSIKRQSYDKNMRYLAAKANMTVEDLRKTNPIPVARRIGLTDADVKKTAHRDDYAKLASGWPCR